jgi:hypothetical protein
LLVLIGTDLGECYIFPYPPKNLKTKENYNKMKNICKILVLITREDTVWETSA